MFQSRSDDKQAVAQALSNVVQTVNVGIVQQIPHEFINIPGVSNLVHQLDIALGLILKGVDAILAGTLYLVKALLIDVGIILDALLGSLLGIL